MADQKISADPAADALDGTETIPLLQAGVNKKSLLSVIKTFIQSFNPSRRILYKNNVSVSLTGTTAETILDSVLIPAGTIQANDVLNIVMTFTKSGVAGNSSPKIRVNTTNTLGGDVYLNYNIGGATTVYYKIRREIVFKNSVSSEEVFPSTLNQNDETGATITTAISTFTTNFGVDQYIIISNALGNAADTLTLRSWYVELIRT